MATTFLKRLDNISGAGTDPHTFLRKLGPIHASWHSHHNLGTSEIGFLLFHWELIQRFRKVGADTLLGGIQPFTLAELQNFSSVYNVNDAVAKNSVSDMENFSFDLEGWHNDAHMNIGMAIHRSLMHPRTHVLIPQFWRLHYFINDRFEEKLHNFQGGAGAVAGTVAALEAKPEAPSI